MSHNDRERGTIKLPSVEFARIRQAIQDDATAHREQVYALTQEFWKGLSPGQQTDKQAQRARP
jgi:hypothetical protein